ncbi:MAG: Hint domain-containing protein [Lachnospiraceae bacterium]|nr:Hint domain-containing protein [Ruminococcus sp.]MCM1276531.1 Hint domain-containing protein [Lachnospiraceae bacterium]
MSKRIPRTVPLEENLGKTLELIGGEENLRKKYPELYKAVLNTRKRLQTAPVFTANEDDDYIFGSADSCKIRTLNYTEDTTLSSVSEMEMEKSKSSLAIIGDITDKDTGKSIDGFALSDNDTDTLSASSSTPASSITSDGSRRFIAKSSFIVIEKDESGNNVVKTLDDEMDALKSQDSQTIVKTLTVNDPMPVNHTGNDHTVVYYNRNGNGADYTYSRVKYDSTQIAVYMPFSGSVELNGIYAPDSQNPIDTDKIVLQIENMRNGCANFDMEYIGNVKWNVTGSVLTWEFPDNWHDVLSKNKLTCANDMNFYRKMYINTTLGISVPIVIQSDGEEHKDPSYKKIPYINILWGCFANDTLIRMENGKSLPIEQIKVGDKVMTKDGDMRSVSEIVTGNEEQLVYIETSGANHIRVSRDHPMLTTDGMIKAEELTAGTILVTANGNESIESLYLVDYNNTAYNLRLDSSGVLIANNFYAGDFEAQNSMGKKREPTASHKLEEIQEELSDLISVINLNKINRKE